MPTRCSGVETRVSGRSCGHAPVVVIAGVAAYFVAAAVIAVLLRGSERHARAVALVPFAFQAVVSVIHLAGDATPRSETISWLPSMGIDLVFRVDALSMTLTATVAIIGFLIALYSADYMAGSAVRFLAILVLFSGGMAGLVTSDNLFGLFVFWEITTIASFLLIGYDDHAAGARAAAVQAAIVTTAGGLAMLAGFLLLAGEAGTSRISEIVAAAPRGAVVNTAIILILLGVFTKSAQVPFHFWLPGAMAAPTPASAYLHSATMVKAGIVVLLLLAPGFSSLTVWSTVVTTVGLTTMVLGALQAMRQHDLKLLLAHGTVSQLGFMVAIVGLGFVGLGLALLVTHAAFKATLFLVTGIIDKTAGTRDLRQLSGIATARPLLGLATAAALMSMAGLPPLLGFVTKEAAFDALIESGDHLPLAIIAVASALTVAYSARVWWGAFLTSGEPSQLTRARRPLLVPVVTLALFGVVGGFVPGPLQAVASAADGGTVTLVLWPGFKPALAVSAAVVLVGWLMHKNGRRFEQIGRQRTPSASAAYVGFVRALNRSADAVTGTLQNGSLPVYLAVILTTIFGVVGAVWLPAVPASVDLAIANSPVEVLLALIVIVAAIAVTRARRRMAAVLLLGAVGYGVAGVYVSFGAPDLALTQLLVETFTVALFAFVLSRLPRQFDAESTSLPRALRIGVSILAGSVVTGVALLATTSPPRRDVARFAIDNAEAAGGRNVVNVILTDFRALDTLGEISVLVAAGIGIAALVRFGTPSTRTRR